MRPKDHPWLLNRVAIKPYLQKIFYAILSDMLKAGKPIDYRAYTPIRNPAYSHFSALHNTYCHRKRRSKKS